MLKPVVVITCLEDSPPNVDRRLLEAYLRTIYQVREPPEFSFLVGRAPSETASRWLDQHRILSWAFLTAWNPRSAPLSDLENRERNKRLAREVDSGGWSFFPAWGIGPDKTWPAEESFWILNISADRAAHLGRLFEQNALVWWSKGKPVELWWL